MADVVTIEVLEGMAKEVYPDGFSDLVPESVHLIKMISFKETEKLGFAYNKPIVVAESQGATYGGPEDDAMELNAPIATESKNARIRGSSIAMRDQIGYKAAASLVKGKRAFIDGTQHVIRSLMKSSNRRLENMLLYGGSGLATLVDSDNVSATVTDLNVTVSQWAAGLWVGSKNTELDAYEADDTHINTTQALKVVSVDVPNLTIRVSGAAADIAALDTAITADPDGVRLFYFGAFEKEALGLDKIITTSGLLFEVDNTVYDLHKGQTFSCSGAALDFTKLINAAGQLVPFGIEGDLTVMINPRTWENLNDDEAALREYDVSYSPNKAEKGVEAIVYRYQMGRLLIMAHPCVKQGEGFMFKKDSLLRVGAQDLSMNRPGGGERIFFDRPEHTAYELRTFCDQALFSDHVSWLLKLTEIVNS